jgi:hypothetical protein
VESSDVALALLRQLLQFPLKIRSVVREELVAEGVGQGGRYEFKSTQVTKLRKDFTAWKQADDEKRAARAKALEETKAQPKEKPEPQPEPRTEDVVDKVIAEGGLPKAEQAKAEARTKGRATSRSARKPQPKATDAA